MTERTPLYGGFLEHPYRAKNGWMVVGLFEKGWRERDLDAIIRLLEKNGVSAQVVTRHSLQVDPHQVEQAREILKAEEERKGMESWPPKAEVDYFSLNNLAELGISSSTSFRDSSATAASSGDCASRAEGDEEQDKEQRIA